MTPKKQVSPAIRILRGERDASARATHLEEAVRQHSPLFGVLLGGGVKTLTPLKAGNESVTS